MSTAPTFPRADLVALVRATAELVAELQRRVQNLQNDVEAPADASECRTVEEATSYVNSILCPPRLVRPQRNPDDCDSTVSSSPARVVTTSIKGVPVLLDVHDVAHVCGVTEKTVRRWREDGTLPSPIALGGVIRWTRQDILGLLLRRGGAA